MKTVDPVIRINERSTHDPSTGCTTWNGPVCRGGYGRIRVTINGMRSMKAVHRLIWESRNGPITDGLHVDHLCHTRNCVNPDHMRLVTQAQNNQHVGPNRGNITGIRGVSWHKHIGKWHVQAQAGGVKFSGGYFSSIEEAKDAAIVLRNRIMTHNESDR